MGRYASVVLAAEAGAGPAPTVNATASGTHDTAVHFDAPASCHLAVGQERPVEMHQQNRPIHGQHRGLYHGQLAGAAARGCAANLQG